MIHVMVPDKNKPTFDGEVLLDHRTVHLVNCVDEHSHAQFNRILRDSIIKVKWDAEWFEEDPDDGDEMNGVHRGRWVGPSPARYYIRIANHILVEDEDSENGIKVYVMLVADLNVKLLHCHKGRGLEDFTRLASEGVVQHAPEAVIDAEIPASIDDLDHGEIYGQKPLNESVVMGHKPVNLKGRPSIHAMQRPADPHSFHSPIASTLAESEQHSHSVTSSDTTQLQRLVDMSRTSRMHRRSCGCLKTWRMLRSSSC
jgi:hypothetical protein